MKLKEQLLKELYEGDLDFQICCGGSEGIPYILFKRDKTLVAKCVLDQWQINFEYFSGSSDAPKNVLDTQLTLSDVNELEDIN